MTDADSSPSSDKLIVTSEPSDIADEAEAEAEALEAEARATAARARARAIQLRLSEIDAAHGTAESEETTAEDRSEPDAAIQQADSTTESAETTEPTESPRERIAGAKRPRNLRWPGNIRRPSTRTLGAAVCTVLICASAAAAGAMWWQHWQAAQDQQRSVEFTRVARQGVTDLMSLNFGNAKDDVQRLINDTSGDFRKDLESHRDDFIAVVQDSKVVTTCAIKGVAVQSMSADAGTVLVAASSKITDTAGASKEQRTWRVTVTLNRIAGQLKISRVEFIT